MQLNHTMTSHPISPAARSGRDDRLRRLLGEIAAGRKDALEQLYRECSVPLYVITLRIVRAESIAEESLQDAFVKIWKNAHQYNPAKAAPLTWMTRIVRNQAIDTQRYQHARIDHELPDSNPILESLEDSLPAFPDQLEHHQALQLCLSELEEKPRYCVVKAYCEGCSHEELSEQTGSPVSTVKSWIRRSLQALKRCLDEHS